MSKIMRSVVLTVAAVLVLFLLNPAAQAEPRIRKNIDDLTPTELSNYIYAVTKLQEKSRTDPTVKGSYAFFAGLHNNQRLFKGACEHNNDKFIPWHRAMLWYYEDALRAVDPPRTKDVTIPYWNWSMPPSGVRYARPFEDNGSVLSRSVDDIPKNTSPSQPMFPWQYAKEQTLVQGYTAFAGAPGKKGSIEAKMHDTMHSTFVGGALFSTATAANDPVFWSFHTFIDLMWWWRQQQIHDDQVTCMDCPLRGMPGTLSSGDAGPKTVSDVVDAEKLGYTYEFSPPRLLAAAATAQTFSNALPEVASLSLAPAQKVMKFSVRVPSGNSGNVVLTLDGVKAVEKVPYMAFVYLHPKSVPFAPQNVAFRDKYLVGQYGEWLMAGMTMALDRQFVIDRQTYPDVFSGGIGDLSVSVAIQSSPAPVLSHKAGARMMTKSATTSALSTDARISGATLTAP